MTVQNETDNGAQITPVHGQRLPGDGRAAGRRADRDALRQLDHGDRDVPTTPIDPGNPARPACRSWPRPRWPGSSRADAVLRRAAQDRQPGAPDTRPAARVALDAAVPGRDRRTATGRSRGAPRSTSAVTGISPGRPSRCRPLGRVLVITMLTALLDSRRLAPLGRPGSCEHVDVSVRDLLRLTLRVRLCLTG